jgi:hypothetical protein
MAAILILSFDMAPSAPGAPRTHGTFEERQLDHMVPLRTGTIAVPPHYLFPAIKRFEGTNTS